MVNNILVRRNWKVRRIRRKPTWEIAFHLAVAGYVSDGVFFVLSFFPRDVLDGILDLIESVSGINRIYHRFPMQTEKSQPEGKRIMPVTRLTEFPALSAD